ncbi:MAG: M20/M25/M40 family metallo-hydrolase [Thermoproteota archaeon]
MAFDIVDAAATLIEQKCVNDPQRGLKPPRSCAEAVATLMREAGMDPRIYERGGYYSVVHSEGEGEPHVMLLAHFDVVPAGPGWTRDPFKAQLEGDRLYGRGALDDLSNVAAIVHAYTMFSGKLEGAQLTVAFTGDEEVGGRNGAAMLRDMLRREGRLPSFLINGDGYGMVVINRRRNTFNVTLEAEAKKVKVDGRVERRTYKLDSRKYHSAYFIAGGDVHPLLRLARDVLYDNLSVVELGGSFVKSNVLPMYVDAALAVPEERGGSVEADAGLTELVRALIPATRVLVEADFPSIFGLTATPNVYTYSNGLHRITVNVRAPLTSPEKLEASLKEVLGEFEGVSFSVSGGSGYLYTSRSSTIVGSALKVLERLGVASRVGEAAGASDSRYFSPLGVEAIDFGPLGDNAHGPDEYVVVPSLYKVAEFYSTLVLELAERKGGGEAGS